MKLKHTDYKIVPNGHIAIREYLSLTISFDHDTVDGPVSRARAYITSHGLYELFINGQRVGDAYAYPFSENNIIYASGCRQPLVRLLFPRDSLSTV